MSYVVNWQSSDGTDGWHAAADLTAAAAHVEHLRNHSGVDTARIFELHEVAFELKPYFKVELAPAHVVAPAGPAAVELVVAESEPAAAKPVHADESWAEAVWPEPAPATAEEPEPSLEPAAEGANGMHRRGLFGR